MEMFQTWDKWMTKKYPKVGFGSKWKTNVKNDCQDITLHRCTCTCMWDFWMITICSRRREEVDKIIQSFPHIHVLQWNLDILNFYLINLLV